LFNRYVLMEIRYSLSAGQWSCSGWWVSYIANVSRKPTTESMYLALLMKTRTKRLTSAAELWVIGELVSAYRKAIDDGVITRRVAKPEGEQLPGHGQMEDVSNLISPCFCQPEKSDARECAAPGVVANKSLCMEK
jgi:hypothetical protein